VLCGIDTSVRAATVLVLDLIISCT